VYKKVLYLLLALLLQVSVIAVCDAQRSKKPKKTPIEYSLDTVVERLDNLYVTLSSINDFQSKGLDTAKGRKELRQMTGSLRLIREDLESEPVPEYKKVLLYQNMVQRIKLRLEESRAQLFRYNNDLVRMNSEIQAFTHDSVLKSTVADSLYRQMYQDELLSLRDKWDSARKATAESLKQVNSLQGAISAPYFLTIDLLGRIGRIKEEIAGRLFKREYGYLWVRDTGYVRGAGSGEFTGRSFRAQRELMGYFLDRYWGYYLYALVIGAVFFIWVVMNFRRIKTARGGEGQLKDLKLEYVRTPPVLPVLVVVLNILPFFNINTPTLFTQLGQLALLLVVSIMFWYRLPRATFLSWAILIILYVLFLAAGALIMPDRAGRLWLLLLNAGSIVLAWRSVKGIMAFFVYQRIIGIVWWIYLGLNWGAIFFNVTGRVTLARIASSSAIFGLVQIVVLSVFVNCVLEALRLQAAASRLNEATKNWAALFDRMQKGVERGLLLFVILTWLVAFSINLNVYDALSGLVGRGLGYVVKIGSVSFRVGNVLLFLIIVYSANLLQKYIGFLYSPPEGQSAPQAGQRGSRLVMVRLVVIIAGFLLAIAGSGLPVDRITIVLGALGVGIGLGLQNIVNNLMSGIILIFERPWQIGDYIELNGKKGIVRDMGIRSSRLVTETGTEIIMPNGDLLAGEVINWTLRNRDVRIEVPITVEAGPSFGTLVSVVQEALTGHSDLSGEQKPSVLLNTVTEKQTSFTVLVWVSNIAQIQTIKSEVLSLLYQKFKEKGIKTV